MILHQTLPAKLPISVKRFYIFKPDSNFIYLSIAAAIREAVRSTQNIHCSCPLFSLNVAKILLPFPIYSSVAVFV